MAPAPDDAGAPRGGLGNALIQANDRLASKIIGALHRLFGFEFSPNSEFYVFEGTVLGGIIDPIGTNYAKNVAISQEADFVCTRVTGICRQHQVGRVVGMQSADGSASAGDFPDFPALVTLRVTGSDRNLMNEAIDFLGAFGSWGGLPGIWPKPRLIPRNSNIAIALQSLKLPAAATSFDYRVCFVGWKIYDAKSLDLTNRRP
jgi:hypothetical protein